MNLKSGGRLWLMTDPLNKAPTLYSRQAHAKRNGLRLDTTGRGDSVHCASRTNIKSKLGKMDTVPRRKYSWHTERKFLSKFRFNPASPPSLVMERVSPPWR